MSENTDYAELEKKYLAVVAENAVMKQLIDSVTDLDNEPQYHSEGMGCGLEDKGITDRYDAMQHGWDCAMNRIYGEVIPCAEELSFPATDAAINEIKAWGVDSFSDELGLLASHYRTTTPHYRIIKSILFRAVNLAASLRGE